VEHVGASTREVIVESMFPFTTVYNLKQRFADLHRDEKQWLPHVVYFAEETADGYRPVEFVWPFATVLAAPSENPGVPDPRIFGAEGRLPIFPKMLTNATVEQAIRGTRLHVWSFVDIAKGALPQEEAFQGFYQLYWPAINTSELLETVFTPLSAVERNIFSTATQFIEYTNERYAKIDAALHSELMTAAKPTELRELRRYRAILPKKEPFTNGALELLFYKIKPTEAVPFLRFFPLSERVAPLVKVHSNAAGVSLLDEDTLDSLLADNPALVDNALLFIKAPVRHPRAPLGTVWTLAILEDGTAEVSIGAPRKDAPLMRIVVDAAWEALPAFLASTPWADATEQTLTELNAVYECTSAIVAKPSRAELRARLDTFTPFFSEEPIPQGSTATLSLRYKAVSNYTPDTNPIDNFITSLFLRDTAATVEAAPIATFVGMLTKEFGISSDMAGNAIQAWINRNAEFIVTERAALATRNLGSVVNIFNTHPKYLFQLGNIESYTDLQRTLTILAYFANATLEQVRVGTGPVAEPPPLPVAPVVEEVADENIAVDDLLAFEMQMMDMGDAAQDAEVDAVLAEPAAAADVIAVPAPLAEGEVVPPIADQWYIQRLKNRDTELFEYEKGTDPRVKLYSRACGKTADRQPHAMAPETYTRARALYGNDVFWVELPLSGKDLLAALTVAKAPAEREKEPRKTLEQLVEIEKRALALGFPLKQDKSITTLSKYEHSVRAEDKAEINALIAAQKTKPLWLVVRAGSSAAKTNYYMCGELWCVRDDLPLIPAEFAGARYRDGRAKAPNSCPFCGGALLINPSSPRVGETVLQRQNKSGLHAFAGIQDIYHPDRFALPCCFVTPKDLEVPEGASAFPPPRVPLPALQQETEVIEPIAAVEAQEPSLIAADRESRDRPFTSRRTVHGAAANRWYIPNQNILGRSNEEWFGLEQGAVAVPPKSVNKLLGQEPEKFLTAVKGAFAVSQNSYLAAPGAGFVRYGLGGREPGNAFLSFVAYAQYASKHMQADDDALIIATPQEVLDELLGTKETFLRNAFPQANYGTLLHEFSTPGYTLSEARTLEFQQWWGTTGRTTAPHQRAYAMNTFVAYENFKNYLRAPTIAKELRHFETLFATPGLFTPTGFIVVRIVYKNKTETPTIVCPQFGISVRDQKTKPPLLFVLEDESSKRYDPLVFYEGKDKDNKMLLGLIQTEKPLFAALSTQIREALAGFVTQYYGATEGCARVTAPIHPWMPVRDSNKIPLLSTFMNSADEHSDVKPVAQLRDRSNRLVGLIVLFNTREFYVPVLDDGAVNIHLQIVYGEEALPRPQLQSLLEMLMGAQNVVREKKLAKLFPGYMPAKIIADTENFVALELECGAWIPFEPFGLGNEVRHRRFADLRKSTVTVSLVDSMPWDLDISLLRPSVPTDPKLATTAEEALDEAYQHLRISFSKWLHGKPDGNRVRAQIELLRQARRRLPLYELQKRLDILLTSIIANPTNPWMTTEGTATTALLRRDCHAILNEADCTDGCTWSGGRCLIHSSSTERYVDPIRVCIARLTDELLRSFGAAHEILNQRVSYLRSLDRSAIQHTDDSLLFSVSGRGTDALYNKLGYGARRATEFSRGLTYPEEVDILPQDEAVPGGLSPDWATTLQIAQFAAPIQRDIRARLSASLIAISGNPLEAIEERLRAPFTGTAAQWKALGQALDFDIIVTNMDTKSYVTSPLVWYSGYGGAAAAPPAAASRKFILLDPMGIPLQAKTTLKQTFAYGELPATLRLWMEAQAPQ